MANERENFEQLLTLYNLPIDKYGFIEGQPPSGIRAKELILTAGQRLLSQDEILELMLFAQDHEFTGSSYLEVFDAYQKLVKSK